MNPFRLSAVCVVSLLAVALDGCSATSGGASADGSAGAGGTAGTGAVTGTGGARASGGAHAGMDAARGGATGTGGATGAGGTRNVRDAATDAAVGTGGKTAPVGTGGATDTGVVGDGGSSDGPAASGLWSMGYYASWQPDQYPIAEIEWSGLTHVAMAFYMPQRDGSMELLGGKSQLATDLVTAAHAHGVRAIASIGGADSQDSFKQATQTDTVEAFAGNLVALLDGGYDGIDIDWEPMDKADEPAVIDIARRIRQARPAALLTIPIGAINVNIPPDLSGFAAIAEAYDQLNIMSYGQAGAWQGWKSWHSSALYHTDSATPISIDATVKLYLEAKVPAAKLGIGIGFYGLCYSPPVTGPDQPLDGATVLASDGTISYANIMTTYFGESARQWDDLAKVPYLSFASAQPPDGCSYISYDDEQSIAEKGAYVKAKGLGGVIEWELNEAYLKSAPAGQRNPLLRAIAASVLH
ncbi:MAG: glycoside hydrolase family 18 protein [Deltaproteobacteria bacterium]|nr:glycoside hydrolase family 18 protein [Deltaproteobacteria bacterium]